MIGYITTTALSVSKCKN